MKSSFIYKGMESQHRAIWAGAWCLMLLAAMLGTAVANTESDALYALRQALTDPNQALQSWDPSLVNPCTCISRGSISLATPTISYDLYDQGLSGSLVPQLGQLSQLENLEMYNNNIGGAIPRSLGNLTQLVSLDLHENDFVRVIPEEYGNLSELKYLRLNNNHFTGAIPESLTGLEKLQELDLSYNYLSGDIPVTGVFANFNYTSFEGNPDLQYPASAPAPAPSL